MPRRTPIMNALVGLLKSTRMAPSVNRPTTFVARAVLDALGTRSEFLIRHLPRTGHVARRLPNGATLRLWSLGDDWIANQVFWRGWDGYEPETAAPFFQLATTARTVLDVGAHVGYFAILAALANPEARVYAFEPAPVAAARLRRNVAINEVAARVTCVPSAVGAKDGSAEFFHPTVVGVPSSAGLVRAFVDARGHSTSSRVDVVAVDSFVRTHDIRSVDLVKIDTETTEPDVLRGMRGVLARDRPSVICEVLKGGDAGEQLEDVLRGLDYRSYALTERGVEPRSRVTPELASRNYLFAPAEKASL
jgi:FkbM family methyltransferase